MAVKQYKKKPVIISAVQWTGRNFEEIKKFVGDALTCTIIDTAWEVGKGIPHRLLQIETLEGPHTCSPNDYIIRGIKGEFYPCKPDIFEDSYEEVEDGN